MKITATVFFLSSSVNGHGFRIIYNILTALVKATITHLGHASPFKRRKEKEVNKVSGDETGRNKVDEKFSPSSSWYASVMVRFLLLYHHCVCVLASRQPRTLRSSLARKICHWVKWDNVIILRLEWQSVSLAPCCSSAVLRGMPCRRVGDVERLFSNSRQWKNFLPFSYRQWRRPKNSCNVDS